ncbi:MAG: hypothetical protein Q8P67_06685 [archaeon]|nr:hypothetical protein [archaeon]
MASQGSDKESQEFPRPTRLLSPELPHEKAHLWRAGEWAGQEGECQMQLLGDRAYWGSVCEERHVEDGEYQAAALRAHPEGAFGAQVEAAGLKARLVEDGYFQVPARRLALRDSPADLYSSLADSVARLMQLGWPASFFVVFDEAWELARHCADLVEKTSGGNRNNLDILLWYIDPNRDQSGFAPHRDRQPADSPASFRQADGTPMYATCWLPFTDACSDNSCLFVLPKWADPGYHEGDPDDSLRTPLEIALASKEDFQNIRCLAAPAGSACVFSHRTFLL